MEFTQEQLEQIRSLIKEVMRQESNELFAIQEFIFRNQIRLEEGINIKLSPKIGTKIGTATDQKLSFWGVIPVVQPNTISDPSGGGTAGVDTPARDTIKAVIVRLKETGLIA